MNTSLTDASATGERTAALSARVSAIAYDILDEVDRHAAKRHLLDTVGAWIAGSQEPLIGRIEATFQAAGSTGTLPVPGRGRSANILDLAFVGGASIHGMELDDGYRRGSVHPGAVVVSAAFAAAADREVGGDRFLAAIVAGYEVVTAVAAAAHPAMRQRGFHPTGTAGVLGAAAAAGHVFGLSAREIESILGIAASSASGLFAFLEGGGDVKRLHAAHAAREGVNAAIFGLHGVTGPRGVLDCRAGFLEAFAGGGSDRARGRLETSGPLGIRDCYIKPYPCCRHLHPAIDALLALRREHGIKPSEVEGVDVDTYAIAAAHAHASWGTMSEAQLSFPYTMAAALHAGRLTLREFEPEMLRSESVTGLCGLIGVSAAPDLDALYPSTRPARVIVRTRRGVFERAVSEALGAPEEPLSDEALVGKFLDLVAPVLGAGPASRLRDRIWAIEGERNATDLLRQMTPPKTQGN